MDEIKESTQKLGDVIKENNTPEQAIESTPTAHQPIENKKGAIYDGDIEKTLHNMRHNTGFLKTHHDLQRGWMLNNYPIKLIRGTEVKTNDNKYNITPGTQKVVVDSKYKTAKSMNDTEKLVFKDILQKTICYDRIPSEGCMSGCDKYIKNDLVNDVRKILNLDTKLSGKGVKVIIPSKTIDIYTRLEIFPGLKLSGHTDTLTEASNLIDEL